MKREPASPKRSFRDVAVEVLFAEVAKDAPLVLGLPTACVQVEQYAQPLLNFSRVATWDGGRADLLLEITQSRSNSGAETRF